MGPQTISRIGSLTAAGGIVWAAHVSTAGFVNLQNLFPLPPGPMEVCGLGVIIWLVGKWRGSVKLR